MDKHIFESLKRRMSWTLGNRVFKAAGLPTGQGWEKTSEKVADEENAEAEEALSRVLEEQALCGGKLTKLYPVETATQSEFRQKISDLAPEKSVYRDRFPQLLSEAEMAEADTKPTLVHVARTEDGIGAVFSSVVKLTTRETLPIGDMFEDPEAVRGQYDEVIGLKYEPVQLFNVIWIPHHDGFVEIRTDFPRGMQQDMAHQLQSLMKSIANELIGGDVLGTPVDLFPLIESMYEDDAEGTVVELSFSTSTGSVKNEKMRRTKTCLRNERYHKGGKVALATKIEPFRVAIRWDFMVGEMPAQPELTLAGSSRGRHLPNGATATPEVSAASIKDCVGVADYEYVREKLLKHLERIDQKDKE